MVGRDLSALFPKQDVPAGDVVLEVDGQITGKEGEKFKAGKLGEYTVGKDGEIVLGPPTEFTATNIDQFNF